MKTILIILSLFLFASCGGDGNEACAESLVEEEGYSVSEAYEFCEEAEYDMVKCR